MLGGESDSYPRLSANNELLRTGTLKPEQPASFDCCDMFVDE